MKENAQYIIDNYSEGIIGFDLVMSIKNFFGEDKAEEFFKYYIETKNLMRKNDIRNLFSIYTMSLYWAMNKEQIAFVSLYNVIDMNIDLVKNRENGLKRIQKFYRNKEIDFSKSLKKLGYSYEVIVGNWKDKNLKDTYQSEYIFAIYSEGENEDRFAEDICNLLKDYNREKVLITEKILTKGAKIKIKSSIYDTTTKEILEECEDTSIEILEKYFSDISNTKFYFKVPYARNKEFLKLEENKIEKYYSIKKQEMVRKVKPYSFNSGMLKQYLTKEFEKKDYNVE